MAASTTVVEGTDHTDHTDHTDVVSAPLGSDRVGRFVVLRELGSGAMGVVYVAYDEELHRRLAIKLLHAGVAGTAGRGRLMREAQAMARVSHPNVVQIYEVGVHAQEVFVAMELVDGQTLAAWQRDGERAPAQILDLYLQAGRGLAAAHAVGLIHRDFKPDNVLMGADGRVRVGDFGLARALQHAPTGVASTPGSARASAAASALTETLDAPARRVPGVPVAAAFEATASAGSVDEATGSRSGSSGPMTRSEDLLARPMTQFGAIVGTPAYMAPEQHLGEALDARSDQFSFCAALYTALYGQRAFAGETLPALVANVLAGTLRPPPPGSAAPGWIFPLLQRGLARDPEQRWPDMNALLVELDRDPQRDPTSGGRERRRFGWVLVMMTIAVPLVGFMAAAAGASDYVLQPADLLYPAAMAVMAIGGGVLVFGRSLLQNHFHRGVITVAVIAALQMLVLRLILVAGGVSTLLLLSVDFAATTMLCILGALLVARWFLFVALVPAIGALISLVAPQHAETSVQFLYPTLALVFLYAWNHAPAQRRDRT